MISLGEMMTVNDLFEKIKNAKGFIFDADGTILDSMKIWDEVDITYLKRRGKVPESNLNEILFPMTMGDGAKYMKEHFNLSESVDEIIAGIMDEVRSFYLHDVKAKGKMDWLIKRLSELGRDIVLITSNEREVIEGALSRLGILECFSKIFICSEENIGKDNPEIFKRALEHMGLKADEVYVAEDSLYSIKTAKELGFHIIGVYDDSSKNSWDEIKEIADYETHSINNCWK